MNGREKAVVFILGPIVALQIAVLVGYVRSAPYERAWSRSLEDFEAAYKATNIVKMDEAIARGTLALCEEECAEWYLFTTSACKPR